MFFKDIKSYSKATLRTLKITFSLLYILFLLVIPVAIVCYKYHLFSKHSEGYSITGAGLIFFIIMGVFIYKRIKKAIERLPELTYNQQKFKFTFQSIVNLLPLFLILIAMLLVADDIKIAYNTFKLCLIFLIIAELIDGFCLKYIDAEIDLRRKALEQKEIEDRKDKV